jgi:AcrR family transcriptional regulator
MENGVRADARRNRERLLAEAERVFTEHGPGATTEEVASRAGVGIGTVFRHFPTKESLLEAVYLARLERVVGEADKLTRAEDPGPAFFAFLDCLVIESCAKRAFHDVLAASGVDVAAAAAPAKADLRQAGETLLARAQAAGAVRPDIGGDELMALMVGLARTAEYTGDDPGLRARTLGVLLDGLRPR